MSLKAWTLMVCLATNLYLLGVMMLFATVVYPQFASVERAQFSPLYDAFNSRIGGPVVAWEFITFLVSLLLYAFRPDAVPLGAVHALVVLGVAYFAITFGWHLPAHRALAAGDNSPAALAPLLRSQWARTWVQLARAALLTWLGVKAIG
jgi:hypothetical protein